MPSSCHSEKMLKNPSLCKLQTHHCYSSSHWNPLGTCMRMCCWQERGCTFPRSDRQCFLWVNVPRKCTYTTLLWKLNVIYITPPPCHDLLFILYTWDLSPIPRPWSLVPRPSLKSGKRVWCSERHFMSHGAGPYFIKNVIIAFLNLEVKFLMPQSIWTTTQPGLQKLETAASRLGQPKTGCETSFRYFRSVSKYDPFQNTIAYFIQL